MQFLYNIGIILLGFGIHVASVFNPKAKEWIKGRKEMFTYLPDLSDKSVIWFHCASLGEFDQGLPLMNRIKTENPSVFLLVTFFSPSGMHHYEKREHRADFVTYIPLDTASNAKKFISKIQPKQVFFVKYEFWSNHILTAKKSGAELYNISGMFRPSHRFFKWYGQFFRATLNQFTWFFVQNEASQKLLKSIEIENCTITGDSRFDKVLENKGQLVTNKTIETFCNDEQVFIVGSSWPKDEEILLPIINKIKSKVIIAPHNIDEKHVKRIADQLTRTYTRYTSKSVNFESDILILDTIGQLSNAYSYGALAYIGGGFSGNLHNILEPAVFGMGVIFGPKHDRFPEAQSFIANGFGFSVSTENELLNTIDTITNNKQTIDQKAAQFVEANRGASDRIYDRIYL
ncbi:3-deoxy-D-manno-octulosonic acid transferase [Crocinitomicaceae bacterium]|nr:3-deoxy-D-manno-octulosonic acid transferase [Crocinitomicaceae bacterium]